MREFIFLMLTLTGIPWILRELTHRNKVTILLFHAPTQQLARKQLLILKKKYNIIPLSQYIDALENNTTKILPPKSLVITYDDGVKENLLLKEILEEHNIAITIFLCSSIVGSNRHYWWTALPEGTSSTDLENMSNDSRLAILENNKFLPTKDYDNRQALSKNEIDLLSPFVDFQSHTCFHPNLPQCTDDQSYTEIKHSKTELESKLAHKIYAIAFPNGAYSDREIKFVQDAGYRCSLTTQIGFNSLTEDKFRLKRIDILDTANANEVIVKASGAWHLLKTVISNFRSK